MFGDESFESKQLFDLFKTSSGGTPLKSKKQYYDGGTIPWLTSGEVDRLHINSARSKITQIALKETSAKIPPIGSVLVSMSGSVGYAGILEFEAAINQAICAIHPNPDFSPEWLCYYVRSKKEELTNQAVGAALNNISQDKIRKLMVPCPPIELQNEFTKFVRQVDKSKLLFQQMVSKYDELVKSRFIEMFGVREHYSSNWTMCGFDTCCNVIYGHPFDSSLFNETGEGTPLIRIRDINTGFSNTYTTEEVDSQYNVEDGDLLVGMDGDFNAIIWNHGPALLNQRVCKINAKQGVMNPVYLLYCLNPELQQIHSKTSSTTVKHLSAKEIKKIQFPIPSMELQNQFADFVKQVDKSKFILSRMTGLLGLSTYLDARSLQALL